MLARCEIDSGVVRRQGRPAGGTSSTPSATVTTTATEAAGVTPTLTPASGATTATSAAADATGTTGTAVPSNLAGTGVTVFGPVVAGVALLGVGGGAVLAARRRKSCADDHGLCFGGGAAAFRCRPPTASRYRIGSSSRKAPVFPCGTVRSRR